MHAPARPGTGKYRCHYCGKRRGETNDHIIPRARGGRDDPSNFVPSCKPCNTAKGSALPTCTCERCRAAIQLHFEYVDGFEPSVRTRLLAMVEGLR